MNNPARYEIKDYELFHTHHGNTAITCNKSSKQVSVVFSEVAIENEGKNIVLDLRGDNLTQTVASNSENCRTRERGVK